MRPADAAGDLYTDLLRANQEAFAARHFEAAYHALVAALHAAQDDHDAQRLEAVALLAQDQQRELDAAHPGHPLASRSAAERHHVGLYAMAARQAAAQATLARRHVNSRPDMGSVPGGDTRVHGDEA
jgi:hypothetical protein